MGLDRAPFLILPVAAEKLRVACSTMSPYLRRVVFTMSVAPQRISLLGMQNNARDSRARLRRGKEHSRRWADSRSA